MHLNNSPSITSPPHHHNQHHNSNTHYNHNHNHNHRHNHNHNNHNHNQSQNQYHNQHYQHQQHLAHLQQPARNRPISTPVPTMYPRYPDIPPSSQIPHHNSSRRGNMFGSYLLLQTLG